MCKSKTSKSAKWKVPGLTIGRFPPGGRVASNLSFPNLWKNWRTTTTPWIRKELHRKFGRFWRITSGLGEDSKPENCELTTNQTWIATNWRVEKLFCCACHFDWNGLANIGLKSHQSTVTTFTINADKNLTISDNLRKENILFMRRTAQTEESGRQELQNIASFIDSQRLTYLT